jgi:hypothetical protein
LVPITFDENDFQVRDYPHSDAFVATANVAGFTLHNILIDTGISANILFIKAFESMGLDRRTLEPTRNSLFGFGGKKIDALERRLSQYLSKKEKGSAPRPSHLVTKKDHHI